MGTRIKSIKRQAQKFSEVDCGTDEIQASIENVINHEILWKIQNYNVRKSCSTNFVLPRGISCSFELYSWCPDEYYDNRKSKAFHLVTPVFYVNSSSNKDEKYIFSLKITPVEDEARGIYIANDEKLEFRLGGYRSKFPFFTSNNFFRFRDIRGVMAFKLTFSMKELEHCKVFDREDYTLERSHLAKAMTKLFMSETLSDVTILLNEHKIPAHKAVLAMNSPILKKMIEGSDIKEVKIDMHESKEAYIEFFRFLYNNTVKNLKGNIESLVKLAEEFDVKGLKQLCHLEMIRDIHIKYGNLTRSMMKESMFENKTLEWYKSVNEMDQIGRDISKMKGSSFDPKELHSPLDRFEKKLKREQAAAHREKLSQEYQNVVCASKEISQGKGSIRFYDVCTEEIQEEQIEFRVQEEENLMDMKVDKAEISSKPEIRLLEEVSILAELADTEEVANTLDSEEIEESSAILKDANLIPISLSSFYVNTLSPIYEQPEETYNANVIVCEPEAIEANEEEAQADDVIAEVEN